MRNEPTRRAALKLAGMAGLAAVATACTGGSDDHQSSAPPSSSPATSSGSAVPTTPASSAPSRPTYAQLRSQLSGRLATPGQSGYQPDALLYNPRFAGQVKPKAIAHCSKPSDVVDCVRFAANGGADLRVRNGGHSYGGWSVGSGLVVDVAGLDDVSVDHNAMMATIGAGALLGNVYEKLDTKGVSIGAGSCATVGITGLTLGGGVGLLTRSYGLTCDQLTSAQVVTADGRTATASAKEHPDLFWALRGGGGSFAAVTSLTFSVRAAPQVKQVYLEWSGKDAAQVLSAWQQWSPGTPRELWSTCKILARPGDGVRATITVVWTGKGSPAKQVKALLQNTPRPRTNSPSANSYGAAMLASAGCDGSAAQCISAALTPAQRLPEAATSSILTKALPDNAVRAIVNTVQNGMDVDGMVEGGVSFDALGGAVSDAGADDTAFPWRSAIADIQYTATWPYKKAHDPSRYDQFVHRERTALLPFVGSSAYVNYADATLTDYATAYWGPNLARLQQVKQTYDPHGVFSFPQAVPR
ncbi:FAD-binding oxidoreductase [uncultured Jatrophihabitans sp.]|uniref:FAD-binding oxidoreductase n=1 Tax=uncultured Jatrophihabitans sp. TaxID=1610747 RepID=UPI0035CA380A